MNVRNLYFWSIFLILLFSLQSCQTEELYVKKKESGKKSGIKTEYLIGAEAKRIALLLKTKLNNLGSNDQELATLRTGDEEEIDYNNILLVIDSLGVKNYIFKVTNHPEDDYKTFHNLVMTDKEGTLELRLMKYAMTTVFAQEYQEQLKKIQEFRGVVTSKKLASTDACQDVVIDYSDPNISSPSDGPSEGDGGYDPGEGGGNSETGDTGGGFGEANDSNCTELKLEVLCQCGRMYSSWDDYTGSICGDGSNPGYSVSLVLSYVNTCRIGNIDCNPKGTIGVLENTKNCNTSKEDLMNAFPHLTEQNAEILANALNTYGPDFGITNKHKLRHFLSQVAHETGGLSSLTGSENLNYTSADRLLTIFPRYFSYTDPSKENPNNYVGNPSMIANLVYCCGRMGNGSVESGDGYRYRGRGAIQLTGKSNYQNFQNFYNERYGQSIDLVNDPDILVNNPEIAILSAMWYFQNKVINKTKLAAGFDEPVREITKKVNGGFNGLSERINNHNICNININCLTN